MNFSVFLLVLWYNLVYNSYPYVYYMTDEIAQELSDISAAVNPYAKEQVALFITGARDLSEVEDFVKELEALGMDRMLEIYTENYDTYIANIG